MLTQLLKKHEEEKVTLIICSSDVASALAMAGVLDYAPALATNSKR